MIDACENTKDLMWESNGVRLHLIQLRGNLNKFELTFIHVIIWQNGSFALKGKRCGALYQKNYYYVNIINLLLDINNFLQNSRLNIIQLRVKVSTL